MRVERPACLSVRVAEAIGREIAEGRLQKGERLAGEQALAGTFGVSRSVVREAIVRLRAQGVLVSGEGRGAFVGEAVAEVWSAPEDLAALFLVRNMIEVPAAGLAARRRRRSDLQALEAAMLDMLGVRHRGVAWLAADEALHCAIGRASGNAHVSRFVSVLAAKLREGVEQAGRGRRWEDAAMAVLSEHRRVVEAIEAGDAAEAERAMRAHLMASARRLGLEW